MCIIIRHLCPVFSMAYYHLFNVIFPFVLALFSDQYIYIRAEINVFVGRLIAMYSSAVCTNISANIID